MAEIKNKPKPKKKPRKKFTGVRFSKALQNRICEQLVQGISVRTLSNAPDMPCEKTYYIWRKNKPAFRLATDEAKMAGCDAIADSIFDIVDDARNDYMDELQKDGSIKRVVDREVVARSKLRADMRVWYLSKIMPKKFGDKLEVKHEAGDSLAEALKAGRERANNRG